MAREECIDLESTSQYVSTSSSLRLESVDEYVKQTKAEIRRSKARAANIIAYVLVGGVVLSLPLCLLAVWLGDGQLGEETASVFVKWYDVVAPLLGAVIGALFGISIAGRNDAVD